MRVRRFGLTASLVVGLVVALAAPARAQGLGNPRTPSAAPPPAQGLGNPRTPSAAPPPAPSDVSPPQLVVTTLPVVKKNEGAAYPKQALDEGFREAAEVALH